MVLQKSTTLTFILVIVLDSKIIDFLNLVCCESKKRASPVRNTLLSVAFFEIYSVISPAEAVLSPDCGGEKLQLTHDATAAAPLRS